MNLAVIFQQERQNLQAAKKNNKFLISFELCLTRFEFWLSSSSILKYVYFQLTFSTVIGGKEINFTWSWQSYICTKEVPLAFNHDI